VYRNYEALLTLFSRDLGLNSGSVRRIFDMSGRQVRRLEDLRDGGFYVCSSGEPFRPVDYVVSDFESRKNSLVMRYGNASSQAGSRNGSAAPSRSGSMELLVRRKVNRSTGGLLAEDTVFHVDQQQIFGPTVL
jgi:hypothetical protein